MARLRSLLAALVVVAPIAAACGGDDGGSAPTTPTTATTTASSTTRAPATTTSEPDVSIPPMADGVRYLDPVFGAIETIENVVYWPDATPIPELAHLGVADLTMDVHLPAGDTEAARPSIVVFETGPESWQVEDYVQRGYVVAVPEVRGRPSTPSAVALDLTRQGMVDGAAAVRWLRSHADELGLHHDAIAATGTSGAGIVAASLAWGQHNAPEVTEIALFGVVTVDVPGEVDFGDHLIDESSEIAAVFPVAAWYPPELVDPGEPPAMFFNGTLDPTYPFAAVEQICPAAEAVDVTCIFRTFPAGHEVADAPTLSVESAAFLYEHMLAPLGVVDSATLPVEVPDPAALAARATVRIISPDSRPESEAREDPTLDGFEVSPDGSLFLLAEDSIHVLDADGGSRMVDLDDLPIGRAPLDEYPPRHITGIAIGDDGRLWVTGTSHTSPEDESLGGSVSMDWFGNDIRRLTWLAAGECGAGACAWQVWPLDDPALAEVVDLQNLTAGRDGSVAAVGQTYDGLAVVRYDGTAWTTTTLPSVIASESLAVDHDGTVWLVPLVIGDGVDDVGTGSLLSVEGAIVTSHGTADGLPGDVGSSVAVAGDGTVWASTDGGLASFDGDGWTIHDLGDASGNAATIATGSDGTVWALLPDRYARLAGGEWQTWPLILPRRGGAGVAPDGTLWRAVGAVLVSFDGSEEVLHPSPFSR